MHADRIRVAQVREQCDIPRRRFGEDSYMRARMCPLIGVCTCKPLNRPAVSFLNVNGWCFTHRYPL